MRHLNSERGSLVIVLPMLLVLTLLGASMWGYQQMLSLTKSVSKSQSDMSLIAGNVLRRAYSLLTAPGIQGVTGCGSSVIQAGATSINALLGSFRDFRDAGGPVTLTFDTSTMTGNMGPSCLLLASELPPNNNSLGTISLIVSQLEAPNFKTLSRKLLIQVIANSSSTQTDQNGQQLSVALTKIVTLRIASLSDYGIVIRDATITPFFDISSNNNVFVMSPVFHAGASGATVNDHSVYGSAGVYNPTLFAPFHMRGLGIVNSSTTNYPLTVWPGLAQVYTGGIVTNVFNSAITSALPIEDQGPGNVNIGGGNNLWDWPMQYSGLYGAPWGGSTALIFPNLASGATNNYSAGLSAAIPGLAAPGSSDPISIGNGVGTAPWGSLNNTCLSGTAYPLGMVYERMSQNLVINMDTNTAAAGNNFFCGLIAANTVDFVLPTANSTYYFFGQIIARQIIVSGASTGSTIYLLNPANPQPIVGPQTALPTMMTMPGTLSYANVAAGLAAQAGWLGRNFFLPIFRAIPPLATRATRFRPNSQLSILLTNGVTPSVAGYPLLLPGGAYPWTATTATTANMAAMIAGTATLPSYNGLWWPTDSANMIFTSEGEIMGDLFGTAATYPDNIVFTLSGGQ